MTNDKTLWITLRNHLPRKKWIPIADIFLVVQRLLHLDEEDLERSTSRSRTPRWERNVRRILHAKRREGALRARKSTGQAGSWSDGAVAS